PAMAGGPTFPTRRNGRWRRSSRSCRRRRRRTDERRNQRRRVDHRRRAGGLGGGGRAGREGTARAGAGTRKISPLPHRRVAAALYVLSSAPAGLDREDAPVSLCQKVQRSVCFAERQSLAAVLFLQPL